MDVSLGLAFVAGLASFLSPCVFPLIPVYVGYLGGESAASGEGAIERHRWVTFVHGLAFVVGFSVIFIAFGILISGLGQLLFSLRDWIEKIGGIIVVLFGLHLVWDLENFVGWIMICALKQLPTKDAVIFHRF